MKSALDTHVISRRGFIKTALATSASFAIPSCGREAALDLPPDIVVIVLDALRAQSLKMYGNPRMTAPFMERLAHSSARFQCFASATWTLPSVTGLFTGQMLAQHKGHHIGVGIAADADTFPKILGQHGYRTGYFPTNGVVGPSLGMHAHFEHASYEALEGHDGELAIANSEAWLTSLAGAEPAFAYVHFYPPHMPYDPAEHFLSAARKEAVRSPIRADHLLPYHRSVGIGPSSFNMFGRIPLAESLIANSDDPLDYLLLYEANIRYADSLAEQLVNMWKRVRSDRRTIFILTSDHGENFGEQGLFCSHGKILTNANLHVPLLVHDTSHAKGQVFSTPVSHLDLGSSILELAKIPDTLGLGDAVLAAAAPHVDRAVVSGAAPSGMGVAPVSETAWAVTQGNWRLLYNDAPQFGNYSVVRVEASKPVGGRRSKRVILPVPPTALRRPLQLAPGVLIDEFALHSRFPRADEAQLFSGSVRISDDGTAGRLALRVVVNNDDVVLIGTFSCLRGLTEPAGKIPILPSMAPASMIHFEAMWLPDGEPANTSIVEPGESSSWRRLFTYRNYEAQEMAMGLEFLGVEMEQPIVLPGDSIRGRSVWHCARTLTSAPVMALRLEAESGEVVWQKHETAFAELFDRGDEFSSIENVLHANHWFDLPFWIEIPQSLSAGRYELILSLSGNGIIGRFPVIIANSRGEAIRELLQRGASLTTFTGISESALASSSDIVSELKLLARQNPEEGHFHFLLSHSESTLEGRNRRLDQCLAQTPFHLRANFLRPSSRQRLLTPSQECDYRFQDCLRLYGFSLNRTADSNLLELSLYWEVLAPITDTFGVEILIRKGVLQFWFMGSGVRPTHEMKIGEAFVETVAIQLPKAPVEVLGAGDLISAATLATRSWPSHSTWKRIEVLKNDVLHLAAWKTGDPDQTRMHIPLVTGQYRLRANALLRADSENQTRLRFSLYERNGKQGVFKDFVLQPGREQLIDWAFDVDPKSAELRIQYVMADNATSHQRSNAYLSNLQLEFQAAADGGIAASVQVYPYWEAAYKGWPLKRPYLSVTNTNGVRVGSARLGSLEIADLEIKETNLMDEKRLNRTMYQLYDLENDPHETLDRIDDHPEIFESLRQKLFRYMTLAEATPEAETGEAVEVDDATIQQLRAIGYMP